MGDNVSANNWNGIVIVSSENVNMTSNDIFSNIESGICLGSCVNVDISDNSISSNGLSGVGLWSCENVDIIGGRISLNGNDGIYLWSCMNSTITGINISSNSNGNGVYLRFCTNANITENDIQNNNYGAYLQDSTGIWIYHNDFIGNTNQAYDNLGSENAWNCTYPSGGNYWSDYAGTDTDLDGIGDTLYVIDSNSTDYYPLMSPY